MWTDMEKKRTAWIGNLAEGVQHSDLERLGGQAGTCTQAFVFKNGQGLIEFASAGELAAAIILLNGATVGVNTIEADYWAQQPPDNSRRPKRTANAGPPAWFLMDPGAFAKKYLARDDDDDDDDDEAI